MTLVTHIDSNALDEGSIQQSHAVHRLLEQLRDLHNGELDQIQSFSWLRFMFSLVSYTLFFTDVLRSGLGYQETPNQVTLEPDHQVIFGPVGYPILHLATTNATSSISIPYWPYKYDSTSVPLRATAEYLNVSAWTPCMLYKDKCDETSGVSLHSVFAMIDSLVGAVRDHRPPSSQLSSQRQGHITLRVKSVVYDRLHDYVFPWIFNEPVEGTVHAIAYKYSKQVGAQRGVCDTSYTRPYTCTKLWTRFSRSCPPQDRGCEEIGTVWSDISRRAAKLQRAYPDKTVEYVVFEVTAGKRPEGLTLQGHETGQLVIFSRIRDCTAAICQTVAVDDYRYEIALITKDTASWYKVVATLRILGQTYVWIRMLALCAASYAARPKETHYRTLRFPKSSTPHCELSSSFLARSSSMVRSSQSFATCSLTSSTVDSLTRSYQESTFRRKEPCTTSTSGGISWTPNRDVLGVPEFFLSLVVVPTIFAQFRTLSGRDMRILELDEVIPCPRQTEIQSSIFFSKHNFLGTLIVGGSAIDIKCILCGFLVLCALYVVVSGSHYLFSRWQPFQMFMMSHTRTPCTAGTLWQSNSLVVSWDGSILVNQARHQTLGFTVRKLTSHVTLMVHGVVARRFSTLRTESALKRSATGIERYHNGSSTEERKRLAMTYIMNLAFMSDPVTLFSLRVTSRQQVGVYAMRRNGRCFLLPYPLHELESNLPIDWKDLTLLTVVYTRELQWWVLLQCE